MNKKIKLLIVGVVIGLALILLSSMGFAAENMNMTITVSPLYTHIYWGSGYRHWESNNFTETFEVESILPVINLTCPNNVTADLSFDSRKFVSDKFVEQWDATDTMMRVTFAPYALTWKDQEDRFIEANGNISAVVANLTQEKNVALATLGAEQTKVFYCEENAKMYRNGLIMLGAIVVFMLSEQLGMFKPLIDRLKV